MTSTDPDAASASSDPQIDEPKAGGDTTPPAKDKRRNHPDDKKRHPPHLSAQLRAREEQVDRTLQKLLSVKGQALQLIHGARTDKHKSPDPDQQENPDDDASAADR